MVKTNDKGITLIALIITIIVMLILVAVTVNIAMNGGIFENARKAAFQTDVAKYKEELQAFLVENYDNGLEYKYGNETSTVGQKIKEGKYCKDDNLKDCIKSFDNKYEGKFEIVNNELVFIYKDKKDKKQMEWAKELGINSEFTEVRISFKIEGEGEIEGITEMEFTALRGEELNLTAVPKKLTVGEQSVDFEFSKWLKDGETISTNTNEVITVTGDAEYTAVFEADETVIYYTENSTEKIFTTTASTIKPSTYSGTITDKTTITKVLLGKNVTSIEDSAFENCTNLRGNIKINEGMAVGKYAFKGSGIDTLEIGNNVSLRDSIWGKGEFAECTNLLEVTIGDNVTLGGNGNDGRVNTFRNCTALKTVEIGENFKVTDSGWGPGDGIFRGCTGLENVTVKSVEQAGIGAFYVVGSALKGEVKISDTATYIGGSAFYNCTNVTKITIPNSVTSIGTNAFYGITGTINIDAASGSISGSPWGGTNATINWLR